MRPRGGGGGVLGVGIGGRDHSSWSWGRSWLTRRRILVGMALAAVMWIVGGIAFMGQVEARRVRMQSTLRANAHTMLYAAAYDAPPPSSATSSAAAARSSHSSSFHARSLADDQADLLVDDEWLDSPTTFTELVQSIPPHPHGPRRVLLVVVNRGFAEMALNLICTSDRVGAGSGEGLGSGSWTSAIPRSSWVVACADEESVVFFSARGVKTWRMSGSLPSSSSTLPSGGGAATSWAHPGHVAINRNKVPLVGAFLEQGVDVVLVDADVVFLRPLDVLFDQVDQRADMAVMSDHPHLPLPSFGQAYEDCLVHANTNTSLACQEAWAINGGFFLLRSSARTIQMVQDMVSWLERNPGEHDQDALRWALRSRAERGLVQWVRDDGSVYPPLLDRDKEDTISFRFLSPFLAPNGAVYFTSSRGDYLLSTAPGSPSPPSPVAIHVNWVVGYARKKGLMEQHSLWIVRGPTGEGRCAGALRPPGVLDDDDELVVVPPNPRRVRPGAPTVRPGRTGRRPQAEILLSSTPRPLASFRDLPGQREGDADGLGGREALHESDVTPDSLRAWKEEQQTQLDTMMLTLRSLVSLTPSVGVAWFSQPSDGYTHLLQRLGSDHFSSYDSDEYSLPRLHSLWRRAEQLAVRRGVGVVGYANSDIAFNQSLLDTVRVIKSYSFHSWMATGMRLGVHSVDVRGHLSPRDRGEVDRMRASLDVHPVDEDRPQANPPNPFSLGVSSSQRWFDRLTLLSRPFRTDALDYFLWTPGFWDWDRVPPFVLGRIAFDNWMLHEANTRATGAGSSHIVIDLTLTVPALHMDHGSVVLESKSRIESHLDHLARNGHISSHFQPNNVQNIRLAGQPSIKGLGKLDHVAWRTIRLPALKVGQVGEIRVVRVRPDSGQLAVLYDVAQLAHSVVDGRPSIVLTTVDSAHLPHLRSWTRQMRDLGGHQGVLVLSASSLASAQAQQLGLASFALSPGLEGDKALNDAPFATLQVSTLRMRATQALLEFGFDVIHVPLSTVFRRSPWVVARERGTRQPWGPEDVDDAVPRPGAPPPSLEGVDMVAFAHSRVPFNVSSTLLLLRHSGPTLRVHRRLLAQVVALGSRAGMGQVVESNLGLDGVWAYELYSAYNTAPELRDEFRWGCVFPGDLDDIDPALLETLRSRAPSTSRGTHRPFTPTVDPDYIQSNSFWFDRPGDLGDGEHALGMKGRLEALGVWEDVPERAEMVGRALLSTLTPSTSSGCCPPLTPDEQALVDRLLTPDRSILLVPLSSSAEGGVHEAFVDRLKEIKYTHALGVTLETKGSSTLDPLDTMYSLPPAVRVVQLVLQGVGVGVASINTLLWADPFEMVSNRAYEDKTAQSTWTRFLGSKNLWASPSPLSSPAMIHKKSEGNCDLLAQLDQAGDVLSPVDDEGTFLYVQPTTSSLAWARGVAECASSSSSSVPGVEKGWGECMVSFSQTMRARGELKVCALDSMYFPPARIMFSPPPSSGLSPPSPRVVDRVPHHFDSAVLGDTGVHPLVLAWRWTDPESGRVHSWSPDWRNKLVASSPEVKITWPGGHPAPGGQGLGKNNEISCAPPSTASFPFRLRVLTYTRAASLERLLDSLVAADYLSDSGKIELEVVVDRPPGDEWHGTQEGELDAAEVRAKPLDAGVLSDPEQRDQVLSLLHRFHWPHGLFHMVLHPQHMGLVNQWLSGSTGAQGEDHVLVLEDDMELSPLFWSWIKGAVCQYYLPPYPQAFDHRLFGVSLQRQHYVVGTSVKNSNYQFVRFQEEKQKTEQAEAEQAAGNTADAPSFITDPAALFDFRAAVGDPAQHPVFKYQLLGTWGLLIFPQHWNAFRAWFHEHRANNARLPAGADPFEPCVPHLQSSVWWAAKQDRVWSQWFIRFAWEQGWYCLYPNLPDNAALGVNHREAGANYGQTQGARDTPLLEAPPVSPALQSALSPSSGLRFAFPPLSTAPLFDFHLQRIIVDSIVLRHRRALHTDKQIKRGCTAKDYSAFTQD